MHNGSDLSSAHAAMLELVRRNVRDARVIDALASVRRERFVPEALRAQAYDDRALPIGEGQTISQPLMVGLMLEALQLRPDDRALEVGAGSGYVAALLARLVRRVTAVERLPALAERARLALAREGCTKVDVFAAAERLGWEAGAPYDAILVSAGVPHVPQMLLDQLVGGGRLVLPVGTRADQQIVRATKTPHGIDLMRRGACAFVPLIGEEAWPAAAQ